MLLRESGQAIGQSPDLAAAVHEPGSGGVPHGKVIVEFGDAVTRGADAAEPARRALIDAVGADGFVAAAAIVGIFNGLVRTADATGIPLDDETRDATEKFRQELGLDAFPGSANTPRATGDPAVESRRNPMTFR